MARVDSFEDLKEVLGQYAGCDDWDEIADAQVEKLLESGFVDVTLSMDIFNSLKETLEHYQDCDDLEEVAAAQVERLIELGMFEPVAPVDEEIVEPSYIQKFFGDE